MDFELICGTWSYNLGFPMVRSGPLRSLLYNYNIKKTSAEEGTIMIYYNCFHYICVLCPLYQMKTVGKCRILSLYDKH